MIRSLPSSLMRRTGSWACRALLGSAFTTCASAVSAQQLTLTATSVPSDAGARAIVTADFDRNGWPDLAHANFGRNSVTLLMNDDGHVARTAEVAVGAGPFDMTSADFNRDGYVDLAVANADADSISLLLGRGDGTFRRLDSAAAGSPRGIAAADMNNDGKPDLVFAAYNANTVQVLIGGGGGTFSTGPSASRPRPQGLAVADFNRDGRPDVAVASASTGPGLGILYATSSAFTVSLVPGESTLNVVTAADLDRNGWPDVVGASTPVNRVAVYFGGPSGVQHRGSFGSGASPRGIQAADFNQDGAIDVAAANYAAGTVTVMAGNPTDRGTFEPPIEYAAGAGARGVVAADFNHDGRLDLATGNQNASSATILWNDTVFVRAGFSFKRHTLPNSETYSGKAPTLADLNGNGIPDLVLDSEVRLDGTTVLPIASGVGGCIAAEFNLDGRTDVVCWRSSGPSLAVFFGDGTGRFNAGQTLATGNNFGYLAVGDMNRDGRSDIVVTTWNAAESLGTAQIIINKPNQWWFYAAVPLPTHATSIALADIDGDARLDIVTGHRDLLQVTRGDGNGSFGLTNRYPLPDFGSDIGVGDFNEDGLPDVAVAAWETVEVFHGRGGGALSDTSQQIDMNPHEPFDAIYRLALGDIDMDGHLDIVGNNSFVYAPGRGDGTFEPAQRFNPHFSDFVLVDFDGNGLIDVMNDEHVALNLWDDQNQAPVLAPLQDLTIPYSWQFGEEDYELWAEASDADEHLVRFEWRTGTGQIFSTAQYARLRLAPGTHEVTVRAFDDRGGIDSQTLTVTILPEPEIVMRPWSANFIPNGTWAYIEDSTAADGTRYGDPDRGAPKTNAPLANPENFLRVEFVADPNLTYKLWVRSKAERNSWANDSIWLQFSGAIDVNGQPVFRSGTTSGLAVNLEECSGCGLSGWGWRDERWGAALNGEPLLLRFPQGGSQLIVIQSREDGLAVDQIVLSAERYRTSAPGSAKNDTTIVKPPWWP